MMSMQPVVGPAGTGVPPTGSGVTRVQDRRAAMNQMSQSMQSGDLSGARTAYASLVRNAPPGATLQAGSPFAQLGKALATGDMSGAQAAWNTMVQNQQDRNNQQDPISTMPIASAASTTGGVAGTSLNVTA